MRFLQALATIAVVGTAGVYAADQPGYCSEPTTAGDPVQCSYEGFLGGPDNTGLTFEDPLSVSSCDQCTSGYVIHPVDGSKYYKCTMHDCLDDWPYGPCPTATC